MNPRLLIDSIVRQTMVLIAQVSTAAGLRSPLAHIADQVFLSLAQEIERQGVGRKVVADMFGLALRSYQRKVQRLEESGTTPERTLWEAVLGHVGEVGPVRRDFVLRRFSGDDELAVSAVLADLVSTGLVYSAGRGESAVYGVTSEADRRALCDEETSEALAVLVWGSVFRAPGISTRAVLASTSEPEAHVRAALERLLDQGRVTRDGAGDDAPLRSQAFVIHPGSPNGWEAAVFDHFQAMANAIAWKVQRKASGRASDDRVGGTTLHFGVCPGHPLEATVLGLLSRVRAELGAVWNEVAAYNREHPLADEAATRVTFYFGQSVREPNVDTSTPSRTDCNEPGERR